MKMHDPFITWSCKITWKTKSVITPLLQSLWLPNDAMYQIIVKDT